MPTTGPACIERVATALRQVADGAIDPPAFTVGDEFQGSYPTLGAAIDAALTRAAGCSPPRSTSGSGSAGARSPSSTPTPESRTGRAGGPRETPSRQTAETQRQPGFTLVRTTFRAADDTRTDVAAVNAALMCRDHLLGSLDERSLRIVKGLMNGRTKKELAADEGISASAVSQRAGRDGLDLIVLASAIPSECAVSAVAVLLIAVGIADLCRRRSASAWLPLAIGPVVVVACAALCALWHVGDIPLLVLAAAAAVVWEWLCLRSERSGRQQAAPLAVFVAALALLIVLSGWSSAVGGRRRAVVGTGCTCRCATSRPPGC